MEKKQYFPAADILRGAAILSVLLYHGIIEYPIDLRGMYPWCDWLFRMLAAFHMPLFFVLSGFVYSCRNYADYMKKRCLRLALPYFVFAGASIALHSVAGDLVNGGAGAGEGLANLLLYGADYWFLYSLFFISAVFPLLDRIKAKWFLPCLILVTLLVEPIPMTRRFVMNKNIYYLGYFALGVYLRRNVHLLEKAHSTVKKAPLVSMVVSGAAFLGIFHFLQYYLPDFAHRDYIYALFGCAAVAIAFTAFDLPAWLSSFLRLCGKYSLQLYLLNGYLLVVGRTLLVSVLKIRNPAAIMLGLTVLCLFGGLFISKYILDKCRLFRVLSGIPEKEKQEAA